MPFDLADLDATTTIRESACSQLRNSFRWTARASEVTRNVCPAISARQPSSMPVRYVIGQFSPRSFMTAAAGSGAPAVGRFAYRL